ncbi:MAG TPA: hypothetical protein PK941_12105 [Paludibacter sp.]|nr:hypothetical protein [Paludibacter sp.]
MKKPLIQLMTLLLTIILAAFSSPSTGTTPSIPITENTTSALVVTSEPGIVTFADPVLEAMVRGSMGKPKGDITLAEAQAVTRMNLSNELQHYHISAEPLIKDLSGLENFTNLVTLDLSDHAVTDISPLRELTKLTALSLAGNPVTDISPLARITNLRLLILSGSRAPDYSTLSNLVNLQVLLLDNSTISDLAPLAALTNLRQLYLSKTLAEDLSPIENIYPNLEQKDFEIPSTLEELGFRMDDSSHQAFYDSEDASFTINHANWGPPPFEWDENIIRISMPLKDGYRLSVGYYGIHKVYVCQMDKDNNQLVNYIYNPNDVSNNLDPAKLQSTEQTIRSAMEVLEGEDPLYTPVRFFDETLKNTFSMTPEKLFALPYQPSTLKSLGFYADQANAVYLYEYRGERDVNMEVHRPEWGKKDFDVRFFTPLSDEYRIVVTYHDAERKFTAGVDDNNQGGAKFDYFVDTGQFGNEWCSDKNQTVEEYLIKAYNDPTIKDVFQHSIDLMVQYIHNTFGITVEKLYALPTGE